MTIRSPSPTKPARSSRWSSIRKKSAKTLNKSLSGSGVFRKTPPSQPAANCSCSDIKQCPFNGLCLTKNCVYQASIIWSEQNKLFSKTFIGQSLDEVKNRFTRFESHVAVYTGNSEHTNVL